MQVSRSFVSRMNDVIASYGLYYSQWTVMNYLKKTGSSTLVEIAEYLNVEKSSITRTVGRLEKTGYIETVRSKDKREKKIRLTASGEDVYADCRQAVDELERNIMRNILQEEQAAAYKTVLKIGANLENIGKTARLDESDQTVD
jgi:MarR family transcriptional regulator, transcriptional regulator for hemolysin